MSELKGFPFKDQLNQKIMDGLPDIDSHMECCAVSLAAGIEYLTGKECEGEALLHAVYGNGYTGGTAAICYSNYVAQKYNVRLKAVCGSGPYLVSQVHKLLAQGKPVVGTILSSYLPPVNPLDPGPSHCIVFYKDAPNILIAMNPWHAFAHSGDDNYWATRFCFNQVWYMEKMTMSGIPSGWHDDGTTLTAPNGKKVILGFRQFVLASDWHPDNLPVSDEYASGTLELSNPSLGGGTQQPFLLGDVLEWTKDRGVFKSWAGREFALLRQKALESDAQIKQLNDKLTSLGKVNDQLNEEINKIEKNPLNTTSQDVINLLKDAANLYVQLQGASK